jgi:hypothetical protein
MEAQPVKEDDMTPSTAVIEKLESLITNHCRPQLSALKVTGFPGKSTLMDFVPTIVRESSGRRILNEQLHEQGESLVHHAARAGHLDILQLLANDGANLTALNRQGKTAVQVAQKSGQGHIGNALAELATRQSATASASTPTIRGIASRGNYAKEATKPRNIGPDRP